MLSVAPPLYPQTKDWAFEKLITSFDRVRRVVLGTAMGHLEHVSRRIRDGITRILWQLRISSDGNVFIIWCWWSGFDWWKYDRGSVCNILDQNVLQSVKNLEMGKDWIFQHDNDLKHTASIVPNWLNRKQVDRLKWPSFSPDLNPMEYLCNKIEQQMKKAEKGFNFDLEGTWERRFKKVGKFDFKQTKWGNSYDRIANKRLILLKNV
jgi:hypothetical protein